MSDTPESVRELIHDLDAMCENIDAHFFTVNYDKFAGTFLALERYAAMLEQHEKVCAGEWVPVGERNPEIAGNYLIRHANSKSATQLELMDYQRGKWLCAKIWEPTHWLDVRLPGGQR